LFFELEKPTDTSPVDWNLRLNLMSLVAGQIKPVPSGLVNRERVLGVMFALKKPEL
jgi:hypothetical protein